MMKKFIRQNIDHQPIVDNVFKIVSLANDAIAEKGKENIVNATIGSLYDEDGNLVALDTVFNTYNSLDNRTKAKYASSFSGNPNFRQQVYNWVVQDTKLDLCHSVIGTPGGSGAVSSTILNVLDEGQTLIIPHIAWGNYKSMATIANCKVQAYQMFDGDAFNITSFKETCREVMARQGKVLAIINDPCHNPTGYSMTVEEWNQVIDFFNELSNEGPVIILDDIAYIDYSYNLERSRDYMNAFNRMNDQVMIVVAFSCSKTLTSYGLRCGGAVILARNQDDVRALEILMEKHARASWSNIPNAAMENFVKVTTEHKDEFNEESDIDIAIIGDNKISSNLDLNLTLELEDFLERSIDLIDINDEDIENLIKIEALNSEMIIIKDDKYNEKFNYYDQLFKENIEFWSRLDKVVLDSE